MKASIIAPLALLLALGAGEAAAQGGRGTPEPPTEGVARSPQRQKLGGPRFGFTVFTEETADLRQRAGLEPIMTQFGWQWETRMVSTQGGNQALLEWLVLAGGLEQDERSLSVAWMAGYRLANGVEFGVGPNYNMNLKQHMTNTSVIVAGGTTFPFGGFYVPVNLAVGIADGGPRITALVGWIVG